MPELPECEANRRRVEDSCLNRTIEAVDLGEVQHMDLPGGNAQGRLVGHQFTETRRHGKAIFAGSKSGPWIVVHLGMTGSLRPYDGKDAPDYAKVTIRFEGERRLAFRCPRKLGTVSVIDDPEAYVSEAGLGPDAMEVDADRFVEIMGASRGAVKSALMAQTKIAGVGNLWSDETLFRAGLHPDARASDFGEKMLRTLHAEMRHVLGHLLEANADYSRIPGDWLFSHREEGETCSRCGGTITKSKVGGRTAYFCADHQKTA